MKRRAIYEEAAERIANHDSAYCCGALDSAAWKLHGNCISAKGEFQGVFGLRWSDTFENLASQEGRHNRYGGVFSPDVRIMALCLAYSVLTYRRPKSRSRKRRFR